ncbi:MAG: GtrA family protein [Clostridia bacterium]|nr:GtrA family protein [Clostridia bacterium]
MRRLLDLLFHRLGANNRREQKALVIQFVKFGLVGVSNTLVSWICYYIILWIDDNLYMLGSLVGTVVSIANAFIWNDRFVFKGQENDWKNRLKRLGKTYVSYGGTSLLSMLLLWIEVQLFGVSKVIAPVVNLMITIPLNFLINKFWTFRNGEEK